MSNERSDSSFTKRSGDMVYNFWRQGEAWRRDKQNCYNPDASTEGTMGLRDLFRRSPKDEVHGTRILACSLNPKFDDLLKTDSSTYSRFYPATTTKVFTNLPDLLNGVQGYDVVHLLADVSSIGMIADSAGNEITGTELIQYSLALMRSLLRVP